MEDADFLVGQSSLLDFKGPHSSAPLCSVALHRGLVYQWPTLVSQVTSLGCLSPLQLLPVDALSTGVIAGLGWSIQKEPQ